MAETDFNDQAKKNGKLSVAKKINSVVDAAKGVRFGQFICTPNGVTWQRKEDEEAAPFSSYLRPLSMVRTTRGDGWGILFEMKDPDGRLQKYITRLEDLHKGGGEVPRIEFASRGGWTAPGIRVRAVWPDFMNAIVRHCKALPRVTISEKSGWHQIKGKFVFVMEAEVIGATGAEQIINPAMQDPVEHLPAGTVATAQAEFLRHAVTNSRIMLAVCFSLSGPLLEILQAEPGIIHLYGPSSIAKTTVLFIALSLWGNPRNLLKTWNSTGNALVALLSSRNDGLLALDELGMCNPEQAAHTVYSWTSGSDKARMKQDTTLRESRRHCTIGLSTGEAPLAEFMRQSRSNLQPAAGQEIRMLDIPADAGEGLGLFDDVGEFDDGASFANHHKAASIRNHGAVIREYLGQLVANRNDRPEALHEQLNGYIKDFKSQNLPTGADGQVDRVCHRFAVIAAAGELAISYGILPGISGEAAAGIAKCFHAWLLRRGTTGKLEIQNLIRQVEAFFEAHGESRFTPVEGEHRGPARPTMNRCGFRQAVSVAGSSETRNTYYVFPEAFKKEIVTGFDPTWAAARLLAVDWLQPGDGTTRTQRHVMPGMGRQRYYVIQAPVEAE